MRKVGQDRATWTSSPTEPNTARELERLRDEDSVLEVTASGGGGTFEVTGLVPDFVGVPAGVQQAYVAAIVDENAIDMTSTILLDQTQNMNLVQDIGNHFDTGTASIIGKRNGVNSAVIYNFASGTVASLAHSGVNTNGYRCGANFAITDTANTTTAVIGLFENGVASTVTLTAPAGHTLLRGVGIASNGTDICAVWANTNLTTSAVQARHSRTTGAILASSTARTSASSSSAVVVIDNGWVVYYWGTSVFAAPANGSTQLSLVHTASLAASRVRICNNISADGFTYVLESSGSMSRLDLTTNIVSVYPNVFLRLDGDPPVAVAFVAVYAMHAISGTEMAYGGLYNDTVNQYPFYSYVVITSPGAVVSDSLLNGYIPSTASDGVYAITGLSNGNVAYAVRTPTPFDDFLVNVTGP